MSQIVLSTWTKKDLMGLLPYCESDTQRKYILAFAENEKNFTKAAESLGADRLSLMRSVKRTTERAAVQGYLGGAKDIDPGAVREAALMRRVNELTATVTSLRQEATDIRAIRGFIHSLSGRLAPPPQWVLDPPKAKQRGTPTLFLSDLHWGETVFSDQVGGVNQYDIGIARDRLKTTVNTFMTMLRDELAHPDYPGVVCALGGDMISGNIHEELRETNGLRVLEQCSDIESHLAAVLSTLADDFKRVFVPCVVGNHGRMDKKPRAKNGVADNLEWVVYEFLRKRFHDDPRISIRVSPGFDYRYNVHGHRYLLTHGDQFKGGSGITGPLLPWKRGDQKKRQAYNATNRSYDTLHMGHWHQAAQLPAGEGWIFVNGSTKGFDEYSLRMGFDFQPPQQTMWITDPKHGPWFWQPINCDEIPEPPQPTWVEIEA